MNEQPNLINFLQQGISDHLKQVDQDAQLGRELRVAIENYLANTRTLVIFRKAENMPYRVESGVGYGLLFESVSYAACVEWALKQSMKDAK